MENEEAKSLVEHLNFTSLLMEYLSLLIFMNSLMFGASVVSLLGSLKNPGAMNLAMLVALIQNTIIAIHDLRNTSNPLQPLTNKLLMSFPVHIAVVCLYSIFVGGCPFGFFLNLAFSAVYQLLMVIYYKNQNHSNKVIEFLKSIFLKLTNPPVAQSMMVSFELMGLMPSPSSLAGHGKLRSILGVISIQFYIFWYLLFRYATDQMHQQLWSQMYYKIAGFLAKLPAFLNNLLMKLLNMISQFGTISRKIYHVRLNPQPHSQ